MVDVRALKSTDAQGMTYVGLFSIVTTLGLVLSTQAGLTWLVGQVILACGLVQWFVLQHEAGHQTLFKTKKWNVYAGHVASLFCAIPFYPWRSIHSLHHKWAGWQDIDPTTDSLTPRPLGRVERLIIDVCWWTWLPLFSVLYRTNNYWHLPRLMKLLPKAHHRQRNIANVLVLFVVYLVVFVLLGPALWLKMFGLAIFMSLVFCDPILFSQHNHMPQALSHDEPVKPHSPAGQVKYTRSLVFPPIVSKWVLMHFDAHELHHKYPMVPGYNLDKIDEPVDNAHHWLTWILKARRIRASVIMFQNRNDTGLDL